MDPKKISSPEDCKIDKSEEYVDCENSWEEDAFSFIVGDTIACGAIHLFTKGSIHCPSSS